MNTTFAVQTFGVPAHVIGPTAPTVPWSGRARDEARDVVALGVGRRELDRHRVSSSVVAVWGPGLGASTVSVTVIVKVCSTPRDGVPSSVARMRIEYEGWASKSRTGPVSRVEP